MSRFLATLLLLAGCSPALKIKRQVSALAQQTRGHSGFYLYDPATNRVAVDINGDRYFTAASNTKILTLYTALRLLGDSVSALRYQQRGDSLIFQGLGDPSFLYDQVHNSGRVYQFLKNQPGKLFFSNANFRTTPLGAGWEWDDYPYDYAAERSAFPIYGNRILIRKTAGGFVFQPARFANDFQLSSDVHDREEIVRDIDSNELVHFDGRKKSASWAVPIRTSGDLTADLLSDTLHRVVEEINCTLPRNTPSLKSTPVDSLYRVMMQDSDNFIAEQLLIQCAGVVSDTLAPEIAIRHALRNLLSDLPDVPQWVDGSGLSRHNLMTPRSIVAVWKKIGALVPPQRLWPLLAAGGKSGTLKSGFKSERPFVFGKTGSFSNTRCLSGFLLTRKNKILIFSFMNNNFTVPSSEVRTGMERLLTQIHDHY